MSATEHWALDACGLWECGECHKITDTTHFYEDRATGEMRHAADPAIRARLRDRCGWRYDYDYGGPKRCALPHWHSGNHDPQTHGYGPFTETAWPNRATAPYVTRNEAGGE